MRSSVWRRAHRFVVGGGSERGREVGADRCDCCRHRADIGELRGRAVEREWRVGVACAVAAAVVVVVVVVLLTLAALTAAALAAAVVAATAASAAGAASAATLALHVHVDILDVALDVVLVGE